MKKTVEKAPVIMTYTITGNIEIEDGMTISEALECMNRAVDDLRSIGSADGVVNIPQSTIKLPY